jgi:hypothetical protein
MHKYRNPAISPVHFNRPRKACSTEQVFLCRFIVLRGSSGFYTYGIYEHKEGWPDFGLGETRVAFKLRKDK